MEQPDTFEGNREDEGSEDEVEGQMRRRSLEEEAAQDEGSEGRRGRGPDAARAEDEPATDEESEDAEVEGHMREEVRHRRDEVAASQAWPPVQRPADLPRAPARHGRSHTALIAYDAGARAERQRENGIAHFLEHLVFRGGDRYPPTGT